MHALIVALLLALVLAAPVVPVAPAQAQVHVNIGINLPAPPPLVVVPEVRTVQYVTTVPYNLFVYNGQYWAFSDGGWYVAAGYNGPWIVVAPQFVPRPLLLVPVRYYRVPPGHWKQWERQRPPHWREQWGHEWAEKRQWRADGHDRDGDRDHGRDRGPGRGHGRGR
jgi:hypothetical protein